MENTEFLQKLSEIEQNFRKPEKEDINIFNILFKGHEEVELHSRFISYLLSSNSEFLKSFVRDILKIEENYFDLNNCEVFPTQKDKSEYKEIDILIINKIKKQAIIIENKLNAEDSNRIKIKKDGYDGQLERYYNTIKTGIDKDGKKDIDFQCDNVFIYYLTLYKKPSDISIGVLKDKDILKILEYKTHIQEWLTECLKKDGNEFLKTIIQQYLNLVIGISNNVELAVKLKELISENIDTAWKCREKVLELEDFKHVKWHTVADFWNELKTELNLPVIKDISVDEISEVTHKEKGNRKPLYIIVDIGNNNELYIMSDSNKGLTYGYIKSENKEENKDWFSVDENIIFSDFSNEKTFKLINDKNREDLIKEISTLCHNLA